MAARFSSAPKTSVLSNKLIQRGQVPRFFVGFSSPEQILATANDLRRLALALPGTVEQPHLDRAAFRVHRIYVTLAPDEQTANFKFEPAEQEFKCQSAPDIFSPVDNAWGRQGWTMMTLASAREPEMQAALKMAYAHAIKKRSR